MERTGVKLLPDAVIGQLQPGEVPLYATLATQLAGHNGVGGDTSPGIDLRMDWDPIAGGLTVNPNWASATIGGVNAGGAQGSIGDLFTQQLSERNCTILLTDRRLALVADVAPIMSLKTDVRIVASVPRRAVVEIARRRRLLQWGRVMISFADGSWVMAMTGMFFGGAAKRLIQTFVDSGAGSLGAADLPTSG